MPLGEIVGEVGLRIILEPIIYGFGYLTGYTVLTICSFGRLKMASLGALDNGTKHKGKRSRRSGRGWTIWRYHRGGARELKAEVVLVTGILFWIGVGVGIYFLTRESSPTT